MTPKNGFLLFIASCLSGCGQMYQGYMKRGVSLLLAFALVFFISSNFFLGALVLFLPVIWLYAFFFFFSLRAQLAAGTAPEDGFLFGLSDMDSQRLNALLKKRHSLIGWVLVAVGAYMLYDMLMGQLSGLFFGWFGEWLYSLLRYGVPRLVITVLVILLGLWFLRGPRAPTEDIPPFTPPAPDAAPTANAGTDPVDEAAAEIHAAVDPSAEKEAQSDERP